MRTVLFLHVFEDSRVMCESAPGKVEGLGLLNIGADAPHGAKEAQLVHQAQGGRPHDETGALVVEERVSPLEDNEVDSGFVQGMCGC